MKNEEKKKSKIVKKDATKKVSRMFRVCNCPYFIKEHVHLKGAITLVDGKEGEMIKLSIAESMVP